MSTKARNKVDSSNSDALQVDTPDKVERIRELIFGPQLRDISNQFDSMDKRLERLEKEISAISADLQEQITKNQENLNALEQRITAQLNDLDKRLVEQMGRVDARLGEQIQGIDNRLSQRLDSLLKDIRELEKATNSELRRTADEIDQTKLDRFSLGELFAQLGQGLKESTPGDEIASLLDAIEHEIES